MALTSAERQRRYRQTENGKAKRKAYQASERYKKWRRNHRKEIGNADSKRYEKTPKGFLMRLYRNMESRVSGIQKLKSHLYRGKRLLPREEFYEWARKENSPFWRLFVRWESEGYPMRLTPTVNRIDSKRGYELDNMEWLTHSENSRLTSRNKKI